MMRILSTYQEQLKVEFI